MYKFIGLAMLGVFAMMIIPGNLDASQSEQHLIYGMATIVKNDNQGNEVFQQSVHNQLTDEGEAEILTALFSDGTTAEANVTAIGAICVTSESIANANAATEDDTAVSFDAANTLDDQDVCEEDTTVAISSSVATIGPLTFAAGGDNVDDADTINGIGICQVDSDTGGTGAYGTTVGCTGGGVGDVGILFAAVGVTATQLNVGETVDITYTFDISSGTS